ncbi:MAG TPA: protein translocase subunit SecF [Leptolinea sp.]
MDIIKHRYLYFLISLIVIIPGIIALAIWGLPWAIDFTGGSMLEVKFEAGKAPQPAAIIKVYQDLKIADPQVQTSDQDVVIIRSKFISEEVKDQVVAELGKRFNSKIDISRFDTVGPSVGSEVTSRAGMTIGFAAIGILAYITWAFRKIPQSYRYGTAAIIAMIHDILVVVGIEALFGHFLGWEVDSLFLTALLTVIGFSVHDTVVVFDRIRENSQVHRNLTYERIVNHSLVQTLGRSLKTQFTVMLTLLALVLFGGVTIFHFSIILLVGIFSGTYSSIFNAAPILVVWEKREWNDWFKPKKKISESSAA